MEVLHPHCAGLDVHKDSVVACVRHVTEGRVATAVKTFKTTTRELMALSDWLTAEAVTHIAMEATGVYWKPIWHILADGEFALVLANAAHVKNLPGRKTDVNDATWLADLMAHGLIRASFVPDQPTQQMRDLLRTRKQFVREASSHIQRIQKTLEDANIKLDSVISDILGFSGRRMIEGLIAGQSDPAALAKLAHQHIRATPAELEAALHGRVRAHHRFLLRLHLDHLDALPTAIASIDKEVEGNFDCFRTAVERLSTIPGVSQLSAQMIVAEIGLDMSRFGSHASLICWAGLCPKNNESAGKRRYPHEERRTLAEDHPDPMRLVRLAEKAKLSPGTIFPAPLPPWPQKGHRCRRCLHPHRRIPCSQTEPSTKTSDLIILINEPRATRLRGSSTVYKPSASLSRSHHWRPKAVLVSC
jgi:transposase